MNEPAGRLWLARIGAAGSALIALCLLVFSLIEGEGFLPPAALKRPWGLVACVVAGLLFLRLPALAGTRKLREEGVIRKDDLVVVVATAHALKFSGPAVAFHSSGRPGANPPRRLPATLQAVEEALEL